MFIGVSDNPEPSTIQLVELTVINCISFGWHSQTPFVSSLPSFREVVECCICSKVLYMVVYVLNSAFP